MAEQKQVGSYPALRDGPQQTAWLAWGQATCATPGEAICEQSPHCPKGRVKKGHREVPRSAAVAARCSSRDGKQQGAWQHQGLDAPPERATKQRKFSNFQKLENQGNLFVFQLLSLSIPCCFPLERIGRARVRELFHTAQQTGFRCPGCLTAPLGHGKIDHLSTIQVSIYKLLGSAQGCSRVSNCLGSIAVWFASPPEPRNVGEEKHSQEHKVKGSGICRKQQPMPGSKSANLAIFHHVPGAGNLCLSVWPQLGINLSGSCCSLQLM